MAKKLLMVMLSAVLAIAFFSCSMFNDDDDEDESANSTTVYTLSDIIGTEYSSTVTYGTTTMTHTFKLNSETEAEQNINSYYICNYNYTATEVSTNVYTIELTGTSYESLTKEKTGTPSDATYTLTIIDSSSIEI
nr:hypothetical protein [Treponema sp.]